MRYSETLSFGRDVATVLKMFVDPNYRVEKFEKLGFSDIKTLAQNTNGNKFSIKLQYGTKPSIQLPSFAQKFVSGTMVVEQEDIWHTDSKTGELNVEVKGMPTKIQAKMKLVETSTGCNLVLDWDVNVKIPLIGSKLEAVLVDDMKSKSGTDHQTSVALLAKY